jgi:phenylalanyl-tRNA synthetase beta subunit
MFEIKVPIYLEKFLSNLIFEISFTESPTKNFRNEYYLLEDIRFNYNEIKRMIKKLGFKPIKTPKGIKFKVKDRWFYIQKHYPICKKDMWIAGIWFENFKYSYPICYN